MLHCSYRQPTRIHTHIYVETGREKCEKELVHYFPFRRKVESSRQNVGNYIYYIQLIYINFSLYKCTHYLLINFIESFSIHSYFSQCKQINLYLNKYLQVTRKKF